MADTIVRFKPITTDDMFKGVDKSYSPAKTAFGGPLYGASAGAGTPSEYITWNYVERVSEGNTWSSLTDDMVNLFHSFGISRADQETWFKMFNVKDWYNAKRMIIASIPQSGCGTHIDGSTVVLHIPTGVTADGFVSLYGSTFNGYPDPITGRQIAREYEDNGYGGAWCYLFGTTNNSTGKGNLPARSYATGEYHPYTGNINGGPNPNSELRDFDPDEETYSTSYMSSVATKSPHYAATHWEQGDTGSDAPYGIALLEKGIFVVFDMYGRNDIIGSSQMSSTTVWNAKTAGAFSATTSTGSAVFNSNTANRKSVHFEGPYVASSATLYYRTVDQSYKMIYFCHAGQNEFNSTSNHTYNNKRAYYKPEEASSLWITEIGLYDVNNTMMAYAKLSEPVEKSKLETLTFKVELEL